MDKQNENSNPIEMNDNNNSQQNINIINNNINQNQLNPDLADNQMNKSLNFGRKRFFNRKSGADSDPTAAKPTTPVAETTGPAKQKSGSSKWSAISASNSSNQLNSISNGFNSNNNSNNNELNDERFFGDGVQFNAKLIGHEFVAEARGEHMCQQSIKKLKILQRGLGGHKRKVLIFISFDGIKIRDSLTSELIYHHSVPQISFISRDETDSRAFGYVFGSSSTGHQFIGLKTQKEAMPIMAAIGQLFAATLMRKKSETTGESVPTVPNTPINEEKPTARRESSITLRASRSESPNVPSMPAPPPPVNSTSSTKSAIGAIGDELDFFSAFEPIDSVFESDFKVNKEILDQMPNTGADGLSADPFASSFGSLSLSSGDWANFDDDQKSAASASPLQQSQNNSTSSKPLILSLQNSQNYEPKAQLASSFNDSSSSMALKELFASGQHNQLNTSSALPFNSPPLQAVNISEAVAIPPRPVDRNNSQPSLTGTNQSVGSTTSSSDRYACFAEIHSISSSIFDSLCDQIAAEADGQMSGQHFQTNNPYQTSKSLNSSLNGSFGVEAGGQGVQPSLSSSLNTSGMAEMANNFYYSFDNPLNSEQQKQNFQNNYFEFNAKQNQNWSQNPNKINFESNSQQIPNEFNVQNVWSNSTNSNNSYNNISYNNFNTTQQPLNQSSNVWSTSSSVSTASDSQLSANSSPPPPQLPAPQLPPTGLAFGSANNRSTDKLNEGFTPVFAQLDPLGRDRPFVDRSLFFAEQKQKPTLRDLNPSEISAINRGLGTNSPPIFGTQLASDSITQTQSIVSSARRQLHSSNANPFSNSKDLENITTNTSRLSPNPFNPFNTTCALNTNTPTPPPLTPPPPPPRPPSRDCPSVPPRNDLLKYGQPSAPTPPPKPPTPELAPPLPRRRTTLPEHRYQTFDSPTAPAVTNRQTFDPFVVPINSFNINTDDSSAPPLPNPQRKVSATTPGVPPQPMARKLSANSAPNWDPFNCAFVDSKLSSVLNDLNTNSNEKQVFNNTLFNKSLSDFSNQFSNSTTSTPNQSSEPVPNVRHELRLSEIKARHEWLTECLDKQSVDSSVETPTEPSIGADISLSVRSSSATTTDEAIPYTLPPPPQWPTPENRKLDLNLGQNFRINSVLSQEINCIEEENHISPPERNIFIVKSDPFADDFFAN